jgi:DnaJ-domain-containing protein 1
MDFKDYYKVLGVAQDAKPDDIRQAFRKAARKYHPDINKSPDAEATFKDVNEAYEGCCHVNSRIPQVVVPMVYQATFAADFHASNASNRW